MILNVEQYRQFLNQTEIYGQFESEVVIWEPYLPQFYHPPHFRELKVSLYELFIRTAKKTPVISLPPTDPRIFEIYRDIFGLGCNLPLIDPDYRDPYIAATSFLPYYFEYFQLAAFDPENLILLVRESIQRLLQIEYFIGILLEKFTRSPFLEMIQLSLGNILESIGAFPEGVADLLNGYQFKILQEKIYSLDASLQKREVLLHFLGQLDHFHKTYTAPSQLPSFGGIASGSSSKPQGTFLSPAPRSNISSFPRPATTRLSPKVQPFPAKSPIQSLDAFSAPPSVPNSSGLLLAPLSTNTPIPVSPQNFFAPSSSAVPPTTPSVENPVSPNQKLASLYPNLQSKSPSSPNKLSALYPNLAPKNPALNLSPTPPPLPVPQNSIQNSIGSSIPFSSVPTTPLMTSTENFPNPTGSSTGSFPNPTGSSTGSFPNPLMKAPSRDTKSIRPIKKASGKMTRKTSISQLINLQEESKTTPTSQKKKLVLIDPNEIQSSPLKNQLEQNGFEVIFFSQGKKALDYLLVEQADLILSETLLDQIDGFTLFSLLKNKKGDKLPPFLFYSAVNDPSWIQQALQLGIKDYLLKPLHFDILLTKLSVYLAETPIPERAETYSGLSGTLKDAALEDVLQMVSKSSKENACIHLTEINSKGAIYFKNGEILHAEVEQLIGLDALVQLLTWKEGNFYENCPGRKVHEAVL
ncbi:MAG: response regulator, partial [Planctomycetota bacterium]